ncbi:MAG: hypothetical protein JWN76_924 [Chitinophagaceae bacterium]|nr:hypothetical protein [Chitinophagaceae bacterium]
MIIRILAALVIFLGVIHISFAFPIRLNTDTLWFIGSGFAIIYAGLINLAAINNTGIKSSLLIAFISNLITAILFALSLYILNEPQVYFGSGIFLLLAGCVAAKLLATKKTSV